MNKDEGEQELCQSLSVSLSPISVARCRMVLQSPAPPALATTQKPLEQWRPAQAHRHLTPLEGQDLGASIGADCRTHRAASGPRKNIGADEFVALPQSHSVSQAGWVMSASGNIVWMGLVRSRASVPACPACRRTVILND